MDTVFVGHGGGGCGVQGCVGGCGVMVSATQPRQAKDQERNGLPPPALPPARPPSTVVRRGVLENLRHM